MKRVSMRKKPAYVMLLVLLAVPALIMAAGVKKADAKTVKKTIAVGKTCSVKTEGCTYQSSNEKVAFINENGWVTAKKKGTVVIWIKKNGKEKKRISLTVKANKKVPTIGVCGDEVKIGALNWSAADQKLRTSQTIQNNGTGKIKKVTAVYKITGTRQEAQPPSGISGASVTTTVDVPYQTEYKVKSGAIKAGGEHTLNWEKELEEGVTVEKTVLKEIRVYSEKSVAILNGIKGTWSYTWGTKDKKPPVITGLVGKKAYNSHYKDVVRTVYKGKESWLLKYVSAVDNRDGKVKVTVDTSKIDWNKKGVYTVIYRAKDSAGNVAKVKTKVQVRVARNDLDRYAATILKRIVRESWSDEKKARAIYKYVRGKMAYVDSNDHASWERSSLYAIRYNSGNCFCYYALSRLLLTRCGIPNQTVTRYRGHGHHWWNFVYIKGSWYHFDTTPRRRNGYFCLWTDARLTAYSNRAGYSHIWNRKWVPKSGSPL